MVNNKQVSLYNPDSAVCQQNSPQMCGTNLPHLKYNYCPPNFEGLQDQFKFQGTSSGNTVSLTETGGDGIDKSEYTRYKSITGTWERVGKESSLSITLTVALTKADARENAESWTSAVMFGKTLSVTDRGL
jgi:hypothetical protein